MARRRKHTIADQARERGITPEIIYHRINAKGMTLKEALQLTNKAVIEALEGLPPEKIHCSVLAEEAIKAALLDYYTKSGRELPPELQQDAACDNCCRSDAECDSHSH